jgi:hypothetical protein
MEHYGQRAERRRVPGARDWGTDDMRGATSSRYFLAAISSSLVARTMLPSSPASLALEP